MPKIIAISGEIGWDVWPNEIRSQIAAANGEDIEFQISSPGGYIYDGLEIFNMIRNYEGHTITHAVGMAASMASYLLMAGDFKKASSNAIFMMHNARAFTGGDQNAHRKLANILEGMSNMLGQEYITQTGETKNKIAKMMDEETYLFGNKILEAGFVDEIVNVGDTPDDQTAIDDLVLEAMAKVETVIEKLKEKPENVDKIAAFLPKAKDNKQAPEPVQISANQRSSAKTENPNEEKTMDLDQYLSENPAAKVVYDKRLADARTEAKAEGAEEVQNNIKRIHPLISAEGASNALIQSGFEALKEGTEISVATFVGIASHETRMKEEANAKAADGEQKKDVPASKSDKSTDGKVRNAEDEAAAISDLRGEK